MCDGQQIENLLVGEENEAGGMEKMRGGDSANPSARFGADGDDDEPAIGGIDDDFIIPNTAETAQPFFSQNGGEYAPTNDMHGGGLAGMLPNTSLNTADMQPFDGDNLIEAPVQINAINLEYAKTAKNIDVRRLKQIIWALLNEDASAPLEDKVTRFRSSLFVSPFQEL